MLALACILSTMTIATVLELNADSGDCMRPLVVMMTVDPRRWRWSTFVVMWLSAVAQDESLVLALVGYLLMLLLPIRLVMLVVELRGQWGTEKRLRRRAAGERTPQTGEQHGNCLHR